jgi:hypothetical protein
LARGVDPVPTSSADDILAAVNLSVPASALIGVSVTGTGGDGQAAAAAAPLATGTATDVDIDNNTVTIADHGLATGTVGQLTTTSALPTGLSTSTNYYVIVVDANTIKFATTAANAHSGTAVDLTGYGAGTQTYTFTELAGAFKLQGSLDAVTWFDISGKTLSVTPSTLVAYLEVGPTARHYIKVLYTHTSGQGTVTCYVSTTTYGGS